MRELFDLAPEDWLVIADAIIGMIALFFLVLTKIWHH